MHQSPLHDLHKTMPYQAAIFDMDGLLLDTERVCMRVFKQACLETDNPFHEEVYLSIIGCNAASIDTILRTAYGDRLDELHEAWRVSYNAVVKHQPIPLKEGVIELLDWLKSHKIPCAVATSTRRDVAERKLALAGLDKYFDHVTTGCEVKQGKPHPEIYLLAASRLNVDPKRCVAFEDSNNGTRAAVAANMHTYQVPDLVQPCAEVIRLGHNVVDSLGVALAQIKQYS